MPVVGDRLDRIRHRDRTGPDQRVESLAQTMLGQRLRDVDMGGHRQSMHAGIRASGGMDCRQLAGHAVDRFLECSAGRTAHGPAAASP